MFRDHPATLYNKAELWYYMQLL